jgi:hypothetical protein
MKKYLSKIAAVLAAIIGAMAVFAGGKVLLGQTPDYYVINWLPLYNFSLGVISLLVTAVLIWKADRKALLAAWLTLGLHSIVMVILRSVYLDVVAPDSLRAMTIRIAAWAIIVTLLSIERWITRKKDTAYSD